MQHAHIHIPEAVLRICTAMVTGIHEEGTRMLECNLRGMSIIITGYYTQRNGHFFILKQNQNVRYTSKFASPWDTISIILVLVCHHKIKGKLLNKNSKCYATY
jgi:hypothetical protein